MALLLGSSLLTGCYYDNEDELYPDDSTSCDTLNVTFSGVVFPLIEDNCRSCHSGSFPSGNVRLEDHATISAAGQITAGTYGSLYGTISHNSGNSPMPKGGSKLPDCSIRQVKLWIDAGTPNN